MITVVVPVYNEQDNIEPLIKEIIAVSNQIVISEIIYVDDGSTDRTFIALESLHRDIPILRVIRHEQKSGQSAAFMTGVRAAGNDLIVLMDGDGQNDPRDIVALYEMYSSESAYNQKLMVAGQRKKRQDSFIRRLSSRLANKIRSFILQDNIRDTGCSLKLIRRKDYMRLPYFDHMHRFLPALLKRDGVKILTVDVSHRPRERGVSKYGFWDRLWVGIADLVGVRWLLYRGFPENFQSKEIS